MKFSLGLIGAQVFVIVACVIAARSTARKLPPQELRFDGQRAFAELEGIVRDLGPRPAGSRRSAEYIAKRFDAAGIEAQVSTGVVRGKTYHNAVALFPGQTEDLIVVLAHHDSVPDCPGAEDNASSVAALIGLGRALRARPLRHTIVLAATDAEEIGGMGAELLIADIGKTGIAKTRACIGLEMLAWKDGHPVMHALRWNYAAQAPDVVPGWMPATMAAASPEPLPLGDPAVPLIVQAFARSVRVATGSDDIFFAQKGVPSLFLSRSSLSRFYPHYHKPSDTTDLLSAEALESSGRILEACVLALDLENGPRGPDAGYLLWGKVLFPHRLLAVMTGTTALCLVLFALRHRRTDRLYLTAAALVALPMISLSFRFQPIALLALWPLGLFFPLVASLPRRLARFPVFWIGTIPLLAVSGVYLSAAASFGARLPADVAVPLYVATAFAGAGYALAHRGPKTAPPPPAPTTIG